MNKVLEKLSGISNGRALMFSMIAAFAYYMSMYDDGSALQAQIGAMNGQLQQAETKKKDTEATLQEEARMKDAVGKLSEQYAFIATKLPLELKSSEMIRAIDSVAKMAGVSVKMKKPGNVIKKEVVEELPVDVTLEGTYAQLAQFIYYTSNLERLTRVLNFNVNAQVEDANNKEKPLRFEGQVVSYKLAPEPEKPAKPEGQQTP